jgi:hypothetical protein
MQEKTPPKRPAIITLIACLFLIETLSMIALACIYFAEIGLFSQGIADIVLPELGDVMGPMLVVRAVAVAAFAIACLITTVGLLRLHPWAWSAGMAVLGIRLAQALGDFLFNNPAFGLAIITVATVFLLNQHAVRKVFGIVKEDNDPANANIIKRAE